MPLPDWLAYLRDLGLIGLAAGLTIEVVRRRVDRPRIKVWLVEVPSMKRDGPMKILVENGGATGTRLVRRVVMRGLSSNLPTGERGEPVERVWYLDGDDLAIPPYTGKRLTATGGVEDGDLCVGMRVYRFRHSRGRPITVRTLSFSPDDRVSLRVWLQARWFLWRTGKMPLLERKRGETTEQSYEDRLRRRLTD